VIRDIAIYGNVSSASEVSIGATSSGLGTGIIALFNPLNPGDYDHWTGRQVLDATDELTSNCTVGGPTLMVSGYLLEGP
jgi:hypothetical protein